MIFEQYPKTPNVAFDDPVVISRKDIWSMTGAETENDTKSQICPSRYQRDGNLLVATSKSTAADNSKNDPQWIGPKPMMGV